MFSGLCVREQDSLLRGVDVLGLGLEEAQNLLALRDVRWQSDQSLQEDTDLDQVVSGSDPELQSWVCFLVQQDWRHCWVREDSDTKCLFKTPQRVHDSYSRK